MVCEDIHVWSANLDPWALDNYLVEIEILGEIRIVALVQKGENNFTCREIVFIRLILYFCNMYSLIPVKSYATSNICLCGCRMQFKNIVDNKMVSHITDASQAILKTFYSILL